jgi:phosphoribosylformylglycinamidine (FGAM) synthase PurS component
MVQAYILRSYQKKWAAMEPDVKEVTMLQDKLRKFRPWHDTEIQSLAILKEMTKAFPEEGGVWVKSVEIRNMTSLQVSGEAKNEKVWLEMLGKMRVNPVITDLKVSQVKEGEGSLQFTMSFSM